MTQEQIYINNLQLIHQTANVEQMHKLSLNKNDPELVYHHNMLQDYIQHHTYNY